MFYSKVMDKMISFRVDDDTMRKLIRESQRDERSVSSVIRRLIKKHLGVKK